jgi:hypothetical protein
MNAQDKLRISDDLTMEDGTPIIPGFNKVGRQVIGEINLINDITGESIFKFNDVIILGSTYILEKFFNKRSTYAMPSLSSDLSVNATINPTQDNLKDEFVFGFVVGTGGAESSDLVRAVKFKDKSVSSIIPFRVVPTTADLTPLEQAKYAMKKQVGSNYHYYVKRFDTDVVIRHLFTDGTEIPSNIDQTETSLGLLVFGEAVLKLSSSDLREYFMDQFGSIDNCRFNSIGLVAGFVNGSDFAGVRTVTKVNMPNLFLRDTESSYTLVYKLYSI